MTITLRLFSLDFLDLDQGDCRVFLVLEGTWDLHFTISDAFFCVASSLHILLLAWHSDTKQFIMILRCFSLSQIFFSGNDNVVYVNV